MPKEVLPPKNPPHTNKHSAPPPPLADATSQSYITLEINLMFDILFPGVKPWKYLIEILDEKNGSDTELLVYTMSLINKVLAPDVTRGDVATSDPVTGLKPRSC